MVRVIKDMLTIIDGKREQKVNKKLMRVNMKDEAKKDAKIASKKNADKINAKKNEKTVKSIKSTKSKKTAKAKKIIKTTKMNVKKNKI